MLKKFPVSAMTKSRVTKFLVRTSEEQRKGEALGAWAEHAHLRSQSAGTPDIK